MKNYDEIIMCNIIQIIEDCREFRKTGILPDGPIKDLAKLNMERFKMPYANAFDLAIDDAVWYAAQQFVDCIERIAP